MRVGWVFASDHNLDPTISIEQIKSVGPSWGSWRTWRVCNTDNVICDDLAKSRELIDRAFQAVCNFYVPKKHYRDLDRPMGVKLYDGTFDQTVDNIEDIISMHLCCASSDIILLVGFDLGTQTDISDRFEKHKYQNRHGLIHSLIRQNDQKQWVLIDHPQDLNQSYLALSNLTCDTLQNALQLLV
jgi:hypothetical protein